MYTKLTLNTDGACRGNPGPASIGVLIRDSKGNRVATISKTIGVTTNNYSEYEAIRVGLVRASRLGTESVEVFADSELAVRQLTGVYRVKNPKLRVLFDAIRALENEFYGGVRYEHVRREANIEADALANEAFDR